MHEEIINLIESPELREHLLHNPQLLSGDHYMQIVGGAPVEITRKRELLGRLVTDGCNSSDDTLYWHYRQICIDYIDGCLNALKAVDGNGKTLLISEISFVDNEVGSAITHGPFPVASWQAALAAMKAYADKWGGMTDLSSSYWMIELFNLANDPCCSYPYDGFLQPDYTYYANISGELYYMIGFRDKWANAGSGHQPFTPYRVDRMLDVAVSEESATKDPRIAGYVLEDHVSPSFGVYAADKTTVVLELDDRAMNPLIDKFGLDAVVFENQDGRLLATVKAPLSPQFFGWLLQLSTFIKIVQPQSAIDTYLKYLDDTRALYQEDR